MLSQTVEYALRAIIWLASKHPDPQTSDQLAEATRVPSAYLPKVMLGLNREGVVSSQRGPNGGFRLTRDPHEITLLDVVNAVEPIPRITECPLNIKSHHGGLCPLHQHLDDAYAMVEEAFVSTTLTDILSETTNSIPLCGNDVQEILFDLDLSSQQEKAKKSVKKK